MTALTDACKSWHFILLDSCKFFRPLCQGTRIGCRPAVENKRSKMGYQVAPTIGSAVAINFGKWSLETAGEDSGVELRGLVEGHIVDMRDSLGEAASGHGRKVCLVSDRGSHGATGNAAEVTVGEVIA